MRQPGVSTASCPGIEERVSRDDQSDYTHQKMNETPVTESESRKTMRVRTNEGRAWVNVGVASTCGLITDRVELQSLLNDVMDTYNAGGAKEYKSDARSTVRVVTAGERYWVVKRYHMFPLKAGVYHFFGLTPAWREWRGGLQLAKIGMRCNPAIALIHRDYTPQCRQTLVFPMVDGLDLARHNVTYGDPATWDKDVIAERLRIARGVGRQTGKLARAGMINRDHKAYNLIVDKKARTEGAGPVVIDPCGLRRFRFGTRGETQLSKLLRLLLRTTMEAAPEINKEEGVVTLRERATFLKAFSEAAGDKLPKRFRELRRRLDQN